ncbi:hypothetical protein ANCCAN_02095 [Ancylostoma caninum]|uniref:ABC transmembrane type-1 domain-containing protein n=1 Tax=Ancylostoma caninum TaxID=29170 RepID=A0A368H8Z1_ANCCA|nr:hypothetical protein ANCCAN_02095 [Ancylostoma caninum]
MRSFLRRRRGDGSADEKLLHSAKRKEEVPKATIIQLFRYASAFDKVLLLIGSLVAIGTGIGLPMMSIIMGDISQNFMDVNGNSTTVHQFEHDVIQNCLKYVYLGCGIFAAATIQVVFIPERAILCRIILRRVLSRFVLCHLPSEGVGR